MRIQRALVKRGYIVAIHLLLVVFAIHAVRVFIAQREPNPNPSVLWAQDAQRRLDSSIPAGEVIFLGDSITAGLVDEAVAPLSVNYGIGWQRSDQLLRAMDAYASMTRARAVVVTIGTNDIGQRRTDGIGARYGAILAKIPPHVPVVMSSVPPSAHADARPLVEAARAACAHRTGCTFVDAYAALSRVEGALQPDGTHLSGAGYAAWVPLLRAALQQGRT